MKSSNYLLPLLLAPGFALLTACGGGSGGGTASTPIAPVAPPPPVAVYPTEADSYEGSGGDNTFATASTIVINEQQKRTLWPVGDVDIIKVDLTAAIDYEFTANQLCATCDTYMALYDSDGTTLLLDNDDYVGYDSAIQFTPAVDGSYYLQVSTPEPAIFGYGAAAYTLSAHTYVDGDGDGYSTFHDCDDTDPSIYPHAVELIADGISQNCSGTDQLASLTADAFEPDNNAASAKAMHMTEINLWEIQLQQAGWAQNMRTLHAAGEVDYFKVSLGPKEAAEVSLYQSASTSLTMSVYDSDGTTLLGSDSLDIPYFFIENTTSTGKTFYVSFEAADGISTTWYVPALNSVGVDNDGDIYYNRDWHFLRDCNDEDATINPGALETAADGIDSNCDGNDDF